MKYDFLNSPVRLNGSDFWECEDFAFSLPDSLQKQICLRLITEVRTLQHELADPNYLYSGRIHRFALKTRDAEIDLLRAELKQLKEAKP